MNWELILIVLQNEIDLVLSLGIHQAHERIIYANPCKTNSFIRHAANENVNLTTVDNVHELYKLAKFHPHCKILIRLITDDSTAQCQLSTKFGCDLNTAIGELLPKARNWVYKFMELPFMLDQC